MVDGLITLLGRLIFLLILKQVNNILLTKENDIIKSMHLLLERAKILAELSLIVSMTVVQSNPEIFRNKKAWIIISGGNADLNHLSWKTN